MSTVENETPVSEVDALKRRCMDLENKVASLERGMTAINVSIEDRAMGVIETLCALVGKNIAAGRQRVADQAVRYELKLVGEDEPANEMTYRLTHNGDAPVIESKVEGEWVVLPYAEQMAPLAIKFLTEHNIPVGATVFANLYQYKPEAPAQPAAN